MLNHLDDNNEFAAVITEKDFKPENPAYLEGMAGSVTFHHIFALHGSAPNKSSMPRTTYCNIYSAMDAWPLLGVLDGADWGMRGEVSYELFNKTLLRGEPCVHPRLETVPVTLPLPLDRNNVTVITKK